MRTYHLVAILLLSGSTGAVVARTAPTSLDAGWVNDGKRSCMFDQDVRARACTQHHQIVEHAAKRGEPWREYRYLWRARNGAEVRYKSRIGAIGVSTFTIGELLDRRSTLPGHVSDHAVSYSPSKDELVIGVPGDGYEFSVKGGSL